MLIALWALSAPGSAAAQRPAFGPLSWEEGGPLQRISHTPMSEGADVTARGALSVDLWLGFSNIFEQDSTETHVLFMDMERLLTAVTLRWGVADDLEIGGRLTFETTGGGFLDSFVLWYHESLGFGQANRDRFPQDVYGQRLADGAETLFVDVGPRTLGLDDARLFAKWRAASSRDGRSLLSLRGAARIPAQSNRAGRRSTDLTLTGIGRLGIGAWYLHAMLGASTARASAELEPIMRAGSAFMAIALERSLGGRVAGILQYQISSPLLRGFGHRELDRAPSNVLLGLAGRWGERWSWDAGFQEDVPSDTPAIDFTLSVRVSRTWR